jgi:glycosyltransferase involved in cell wall biosynthesis
MAEAFAGAGHDVVLWTQNWSHAKKARRPETPSGAPLELRYVPVPGYSRNISLRRIFSHWRFAENWRKAADAAEEKPDLVVVSSPPLFIGREVRGFCKRNNAKCIVDIMDAWPETFERVVPKWCLKPLARTAKENYLGADGITAVAKRYIEMAKAYGAKSPMHLCHHGIKATPGANEAVQREVSETLKLVYIGNMSLSYDLATVVDAVKSDEGLELDLAGSGPDEPSLRARAADCGRIRFHGYLGESELRNLLAKADVGVVPMFDESCVGVPYKLADYVAAGLPVASSLHGETAELLAAHDAGVTYQAGDAVAFCKAARLAAAFVRSSTSLARIFDADRLYGEYAEFAKRIAGLT